MLGINDGRIDRKELDMQKNPIAKDLRTSKYRKRIVKNKKKEENKRRARLQKSMELLYKLEFMR
tara:strand:- start:1 stop:192 length:192 start_codon:yes stop_codon:yes gene_type:complete